MAGVPIAIGYDWRQSILVRFSDASDAVFPVGGTFRADVRKQKGSSVLAALTTENGGITRTGDFEVVLFLSAEQTATMVPGHVYLDFVRTNLPQQYVYLLLKVAVVQTVTEAA